MSTNQGQPTLQELMSRVAALEQAHARLLAELTSVQGAQVATGEQKPMVGAAPATTSSQGSFASSNVNTPAVTANGTNGATGVQASSDRGFGIFGQSTSLTGVSGQSTSGIGVEGSSTGRGTGVSGQSTSGIGVSGQSNTGLAGQFLGNVTVVGHLSSGAGTFVSSVGSTPAITANGTIGATGVQVSSDSGIGIEASSQSAHGIIAQSNGSGNGVEGGSDSGVGVAGSSVSGTGVRGESHSGLAGEFIGNIGITGNIGIGTTTPQAKLDISGGTTEGLHIANANQSPYALMMNNITFGSTDATGFGLWQGNTGTAVLTNNNNNAISISSSGNVGIGTTTPGAKLEVDGELSISGVASYDNGLLLTGSLADTGLSIANTSTGGKKFALFSAGSGSSASAGSFNIYDDTAGAYRLTIDSSGNVGIGTTSPSGTLDVNGQARVTVLEIVGGADLAEPFSVEGSSDVEPGTVMVIDENCPGNLKISESAYDRKVAGIISGANGVGTGLTLQNGSPSTGIPLLALVGRVYCKVEALSSPIQPGDLLTTSSLPGHAMKAVDGSSSSGAILGKAMTALSEGTGLVLVLVNLQ